MENSNKPIYPIFNNDGFCSHDNTIKYPMLLNGLTKREYFAGLAMQGLLSSFVDKAGNGSWGTENDMVAKISVELADELLKQLEK